MMGRDTMHPNGDHERGGVGRSDLAPSGVLAMPTKFAQALQEAEAEQVLEACRSLYLSPDDRAYVIAKHRRGNYLLAVILVRGGSVLDYVGQVVEARPPAVQPRSRFR